MKPSRIEELKRIQRWLDGELPAGEAREVATRVADDPELSVFASNVTLLGEVLRAVDAHATESLDEEALVARVQEAIAIAPGPVEARELLLLAIGREEGLPLAAADNARVDRFIETSPSARWALDDQRQFADLHRAAVETVADRIDFEALAEQTMARLASEAAAPKTVEAAAPSAQPGMVESLRIFFQRWQPAILSVAAVAAVLLLLFPRAGDDVTDLRSVPIPAHQSGGITIDMVHYQPGFRGSVSYPEEENGIPVIWFDEDAPNEDDEEHPL